MTIGQASLRILLIDDDAAIRQSIAYVVRAIGHEIVTVASLAEGLVHFSESNPQIVITDMMMPTGSGLEAVTQIRTQDAAVIIVAISGSDDRDGQGMLASARRAGADYCLSKPFSLMDLEQLFEAAAETLAAGGRA